MNRQLLRAKIVEYGETQQELAKSMGLSESRLSAKLNRYRGADFTTTEIYFIRSRYNLSDEQTETIFF